VDADYLNCWKKSIKRW